MLAHFLQQENASLGEPRLSVARLNPNFSLPAQFPDFPLDNLEYFMLIYLPMLLREIMRQPAQGKQGR